MRRSLITGITGQDGSYLAEFLLSKPDYEVHGLVRRSSSLNRQRIDHLFARDPSVHERFHLHYADLADASSMSMLMEQVRPDEVYNLGAQSHVRVSFATNDERTAKRVSDALGTATEIRDAKNYAGHRLSPWLGHLMVSRQETARPLLTPGEVMQLPATDELVLVSGCPPIRAKKVRYYEDQRFKDRILSPPKPKSTEPSTVADDWSGSAAPNHDVTRSKQRPSAVSDDDSANGGIRREPELPEHEEIAPEPAKPSAEFAFGEDEADDDAARARMLRAKARGLARQAAMDPGDGLDL